MYRNTLTIAGAIALVVAIAAPVSAETRSFRYGEPGNYTYEGLTTSNTQSERDHTGEQARRNYNQ